MALLKFGTIPYYNSDQVAGSNDPDDISNIYLEGAPDVGLVIRRRPGLTEFTTLGVYPGQGIFEWEATGLVIAVAAGQVYTVAESGTVTNITTAELDTTAPVIFADGARLDGTPFLYIANGKLVYSENGANTAYPADTSTPSTATHVAYLNLRFLANVPGTQQFLFTDTNPGSGVLEPDYWSSSDNPLVAESAGDDILGIWVFLQEIYVWGSRSLEIFQDDGSTPFAPVPQAASHVGLEAKNSVVIADNTMMALCVIDGSRCVIRMQGRSPQIVSQAIEAVLSGYETVSDAIGQIVSVGGLHIYLLQFPSEGKTWAYNMTSRTWVPWNTFNVTYGTQEQFIGQHSVFVRAWNKHLIMSRVDGKIYEFDRSVYEDDGVPIKTYRRTVWEDHGSGNRKQSKRIRIKLKTGQSETGAAYLRWADDGAEEWSPYMELPLYPKGSRDFVVDIPRMGKYKSRRYEISLTDDTDLCVVWADEEVTVLRF